MSQIRYKQWSSALNGLNGLNPPHKLLAMSRLHLPSWLLDEALARRREGEGRTMHKGVFPIATGSIP